MAQTTTNAAHLLKTIYGPGIKNAVNNSSALWQTIERRTDKIDWEGEKYVWTIRTGRSGSVRSLAEGEKVPPADRQRGNKAEVTTKETVGTIKVTRKALKASRSNRGSLLRVLDDESNGIETDLINNLNRQVVGRGYATAAAPTVARTGVIARVNGAPAANVITLDDGTNAITDAEMRYFFVGMFVSAVDPDGTVQEAGMEVTGVDVAARTITVDDDGATADNDLIVLGDANGMAYDDEMFGLRVLINDLAGDKYDGTNAVLVHGISAATVPSWQSQVESGPVGERVFADAWTARMTSGNGRTPDNSRVIFMSHEQWDEFGATLISQRRYDGKSTSYGTGWDAIKIVHGVLVPDRYIPTNTAFDLDMRELALAVNSPLEWDDEDGEILFKTADELAYEARMVIDANLVVLNRNSHVRITLDAL